jgi:hypothetical protein
MMFRTTAAATAPPAQDVPLELIQLVSLVELELSLPAPAQGWAAHLADRNIEIVSDDIGRPSISRSAARQLLAERAEAEERKRQILARVDAAAVEFDRQWRAQLGVGVPATAIPHGMTYAAAAQSLELDGVGYQPKQSLVADVLDNSPGVMVFHPIQSVEE